MLNKLCYKHFSSQFQNMKCGKLIYTLLSLLNYLVFRGVSASIRFSTDWYGNKRLSVKFILNGMDYTQGMKLLSKTAVRI